MTASSRSSSKLSWSEVLAERVLYLYHYNYVRVTPWKSELSKDRELFTLNSEFTAKNLLFLN